MDLETSLSNINIKTDNYETEARKSDSGFEKNIKRAETTSASSYSEVEDENKEKFMRLIKEARQLAENGDVASGIKMYEKAQKIKYSTKLEQRILKMKAFLAEQTESNHPKNDMKQLAPNFYLHRKLFDQLYDHQKEGVLWLWSLYQKKKGGILADDMGLGKTIQIIAFLAGMFDTQNVKCVMIVVPLSVMPNWLNEFNKWTPGINVQEYHGNSKKEKERALSKVRTRGGVLLITYGLVMTTKEVLSEKHGQEFVWDYIILDEGHKIKNATKTSKSVHHVPAKNRIILTGTPVQNNLKELWSLFDYAHQGSLLGTLRTFKMEFETPIIRAREKDATMVEKKLGQEMAETLKNIIKPYFLRRTKAEVQAKKDSHQGDSKSLQMPSLTRKNDLVIWLKLTETQQKIYQDFLSLDSVKELLMTKKSPLVALTVLKKICDHPRLLSTRACLQLGLDGDNFDEEALENAESYESAVSQINNIPEEVLINESGKMIILQQLLERFRQEKHKTLIFSSSRKILDIIQKILHTAGHKVLRLDGTVTSLTARDELVQKFQRDPSYTVFLLTIQVGGVGLTITSADRVVIYDPSWNPATDAQAVDRAYRIGQQKNVVIYRLITCGTVEEKIYRRQVFKDSITRQTTGNTKNPYRYFTKMELRELFTLDDPNVSKTQLQLQELHSHQRLTDESLDEHIAYLYSLDIFGISDHDLMYKQGDVNDSQDEAEAQSENAERDVGFIQHKIQKAQMLIAEESSVPSTYEERSKGMMKYPSSSTGGGSSRSTNYFQPSPNPSPLFTQVTSSSGESESDPINISDNNPDTLASDIQNMSVSQDDIFANDKLKQEISSPTKNLYQISSPRKTQYQVSSPSKQRKPLQLLTPDEVRKRSPLLAGRPGLIQKEEIVISPDINSPIVKLEKSNLYERLSPVKLFSNDELNPCIKEDKADKKQLEITSALLSCDSVKAGSSRTCSTPKSSKTLVSKTLIPDSLLAKSYHPSPRNSPIQNILVAESPMSPLFDSSPKNSSSSHSSVYGTPSGDASFACRKLSFVEETPEASLNRKESSIKASVESMKSKRRSVCLQKPMVVSSSDESDNETGHSGQFINEEDEENNKENDPIQFKRVGRRNVIISDSESDNGSCFEVSDEEYHHSGPTTPVKKNARDQSAPQTPVKKNSEVSMEGCIDSEAEESQMEEEAELNPEFIQLVQDSKRCYKQKNYVESLHYMERALQIHSPPELLEMAEKIRRLIDQS
ncbi:DNA excision repair protein ERCC-6 [Biomphalaria pfeifferi]|uniref:DNA excision repair protein ERCC-6 n=1 Tax=Biomphalaria pfeifferi TaxID=112525 RepID=A0AAD8AY08_BIOPF|nr:DNA excision repair protein ERCC-6 [Biomphalaria pfeifferi]